MSRLERIGLMGQCHVIVVATSFQVDAPDDLDHIQLVILVAMFIRIEQ